MTIPPAISKPDEKILLTPGANQITAFCWIPTATTKQELLLGQVQTPYFT